MPEDSNEELPRPPLERLDFDEAEVEQKRQQMVDAYAAIPAHEYYPEDHPARAELCPGSLLKLYDDVEMKDGQRFRVIAPAVGRDRVTVLGDGPFGAMISNVRIHDIVDRAPADPSEERMPVLGLIDPDAPPPSLTPPPYIPPPPPIPTPPDAPPTDEALARLRADAFSRIDRRSDQLIAAGFDFAGVRFSLSNEAQIRYTNMMMLADKLAPMDINSLDDTVAITLDSAQMVQGFCLTALSYVKGVVDSGTIEKNRARAMTGYEELTNFVDSRPPPTLVLHEPGTSTAPGAAPAPTSPTPDEEGPAQPTPPANSTAPGPITEETEGTITTPLEPQPEPEPGEEPPPPEEEDPDEGQV